MSIVFKLLKVEWLLNTISYLYEEIIMQEPEKDSEVFVFYLRMINDISNIEML